MGDIVYLDEYRKKIEAEEIEFLQEELDFLIQVKCMVI